MIYQVRHRSLVSYATRIAHARFNLRLRPFSWPGQSLRASNLTLDPLPYSRVDYEGPYLTNVTRVSFRQSLSMLDVLSEFEIEIVSNPVPDTGPSLREVREAALARRDVSSHAPIPYMFNSRIAGFEPDIADWASSIAGQDQDIIGVARKFASVIHDEFAYQRGVTTSSTPPAQSFAERKGVCQDFAHVMIIALRAQGIPAAYASGYLRTEPAPGAEKLIGADAMHAWVMVWCGEEIGWIGFDPTNDCVARDDHIFVAMGRDYADVAPIDGVFIGRAPQKMQVAVDVVPLPADQPDVLPI